MADKPVYSAAIYTTTGKLVSRIAVQHNKTFFWNGAAFPTGRYVVHLAVAGETISRAFTKM
jgi:hypothetical protein